MFSYGICNIPDEEIFFKQCKALEKNIKGLKKERLLIDVDNSKIQVYYYNNKEIKVINSYYENELYIDSEIDLEPFFKRCKRPNTGRFFNTKIQEVFKMKCREKNSEKTFIKVENTENFWAELKETNIKVIQISEKGIVVSDSLSKLFVEFGKYLIISDDNRAEVYNESDFNKRYEIADDSKINTSDRMFKELLESTKQFIDELIKVKNIIPNINLNFSDKTSILDINEVLETIKKSLENFKL